MKKTERNPFLYADKGEQIKRINKSLIFVYRNVLEEILEISKKLDMYIAE